MSDAVKYTVVKELGRFLMIADLDEARLNATYVGGHGFIWDREGEHRLVPRGMILWALDQLKVRKGLIMAGRGENLIPLCFVWDECRLVLRYSEVTFQPPVPGTDSTPNH